MKSKVKLPMKLETDNKGAVDVANNWKAGGNTRHHMDVRLCFLRDSKEDDVVATSWTSNVNMSSDIFTKNVGGPDFRKHSAACVSDE